MAKTKATHHGECQLCGRQQKLPSGRLSIHGYTVQWSCFLGTCPGTAGKPYEQSCDLIAGEMKNVKLSVDAQEAAIKALEETPFPLEATKVRCYVKYGQGRDSKTGYQWVTTQVRARNVPYVQGEGSYTVWESLSPENDALHPNKWNNVTVHDTEVLKAGVGRYFTDLYVNGCLRVQLENTKSYLKFLQARLKNWVLKDLTSVVGQAAERKATSANARAEKNAALIAKVQTKIDRHTANKAKKITKLEALIGQKFTSALTEDYFREQSKQYGYEIWSLYWDIKMLDEDIARHTREIARRSR